METSTLMARSLARVLCSRPKLTLTAETLLTLLLTLRKLPLTLLHRLPTLMRLPLIRLQTLHKLLLMPLH